MMTTKQSPAIFRRARDLLADGRRCVGGYAMIVPEPDMPPGIAANWQYVRTLDDLIEKHAQPMCAYCPAGAIIVAALEHGQTTHDLGHGRTLPAELYAFAAILGREKLATVAAPIGLIASWNDNVHTTDDDVFEKFTAAIAAADAAADAIDALQAAAPQTPWSAEGGAA